MLDTFDLKIAAALEKDASLTNAELSERVLLSPSQCSRRRNALERSGVIRGYHARLDHGRLGRGVQAITRVTLDLHNPDAADAFAKAMRDLDEIVWAAVVTGDADYVLLIRVASLDALAEFIHARLLSMRAVRQVRSDIVLRILTDGEVAI